MDFERIKIELEKAKTSLENAKLSGEEKKIIFSKITDKILENESLTHTIKSEKKKSHKKIKIIKGENETRKRLKEEEDNLVKMLSRSKYSIIYKLESALNQSFFLLKIAEEKNVKGLTPGQISNILKEVFKIKKSQAAVSMALMKATEYADRKKINLGGTFAYKYEIMKRGEDYINKKLNGLRKSDNQGLHVQKEDTSSYDESDKIESE